MKVAVLALAALAVGCGGRPARSSDRVAPTSLATVATRTLSETTPVGGTLGYAGSYTVLGGLRGMITALPAGGQVIRNGHVLYRVDDAPAVLLYGSTPAYRTLAEGAIGKDVSELNRDLMALGYASRAEIDPWPDAFGWATRLAVERLQEHLGVPQTGTLALGTVVFLPTAARVTHVRAVLGGPAGGAVLSATSTAREVSVDLDAGLQSQVKQGDRVTITLPDTRTTPGRVSSVGTVATAGSSPTVPLRIALTRPRDVGHLDQAPVEVAITNQTVHRALVVPVDALLALAGGRYAVEITDPRHLVTVSLGLFDDEHELVQVTGSGLAAGQHVVVPS
jgi:peptidoglycan hydrolase-like protein with peptidoglycan-binding domain